MYSDPYRRQDGAGWKAKTTAYTAAASIAAACAGSVLGLVGTQLSLPGRAAIASLLALLGLAAGVLDLGSSRLPLLQCDRETPQSWMRFGALRWAAVNGAMLGLGFTSRIGFWLWYVVPTGSLLLGDPWLGAAIYGLYGFVRSGAVWLLVLGKLNRVGRGEPSDWLVMQYWRARTVAAAQLVVLAAATVVIVGL